MPDQSDSSTTQGNEVNVLVVKLCELTVVREARIEDQCRRDGPGDFLPEGDELVDLLVGLGPTEIGLRVEDELGGRILSEDGQRALDPFAAGTDPVLVEHGFFAPVRGRVKVEVDGLALIQAEPMAGGWAPGLEG